ncbi:MAG TPA: 2-amino-4-hydroxy-6-hydroxymethyldihydropteridine diphosphokinase [Agriterribacter sp.]|nr:2-amino-4-hydroxy-6-hydroxymethyldihydropteridine diphosphokinase [Agriterribacter sp.]
MNKAYLLIGGNIGDRKKNLREAVNAILEQIGEVTQLSHLYETAAWGKPDQPSFFNQALTVITGLSELELLHSILNIEKQMGRHRLEKYGPRIIDIDILMYNNAVVDIPELKIPHPELVNRRFALAPLQEIAPALVHPALHKSIDQLLQACPDSLDVKKLEN